MKKIILTAIILILSSVFAWAEISGVPQLINYQGKLTDANGEPLPTAEYKLEFNVYNDATVGSIKWGPQTFESVPVVRGYFNVILGPVDTGNRLIIDAFSGPERYLGIKVNDGAEIQPRQQILSAPYAMAAGELSFAWKNTDWGRILFESTGDGAHQSNMVFETYDNQNEGFIFRTSGVERARIDDRGLIVSNDKVEISRDSSETTGGKILFLELAQKDSSTHQVPVVYPSIRFHHSWRFWNRIEGRADGIHFKDGSLNSDKHIDIHAGNIKSNGKKVLTQASVSLCDCYWKGVDSTASWECKPGEVVCGWTRYDSQGHPYITRMKCCKIKLTTD